MPPHVDADRLVQRYLNELGISYEGTDGGSLKVDCGTTAVYIRVRESGKRRIVVLLAPVLVEVDARPEQLAELLAANAALPFGKFSWHANEQTITVEWELLGDFLDRDELAVALRSVGEVADASDELLKGFLGGRMPHVE